MDHEELVRAWETYQQHHHKGTPYDYAAFSDALRPFVSKVESDFDALAAELAAVQAKAERLAVVARAAYMWQAGPTMEGPTKLWKALDQLKPGDVAYNPGDLAAPETEETA